MMQFGKLSERPRPFLLEKRFIHCPSYLQTATSRNDPEEYGTEEYNFTNQKYFVKQKCYNGRKNILVMLKIGYSEEQIINS